MIAGFGYVPLNRTFPLERTQYMLERAECGAIVVDDESVPQLSEVLAGLDRRLLVIVPGEADVEALRAALPGHVVAGRAELDAATAPAPARVDGEATAYILFTSGSTGTPKGVEVSHRNVRAFLDYVVPPLRDPARPDRLSQRST